MVVLSGVFLALGIAGIKFTSEDILRRFAPYEETSKHSQIDIPPESARQAQNDKSPSETANTNESGQKKNTSSQSSGLSGGSYVGNPYSNSTNNNSQPSAPVVTTDSIMHSNSSSITYVNNLRSQAGISSLVEDSVLNQNAQSYARYLADNCLGLTHQDLNPFLGQKLGSGVTITAYGENLASAWGYDDNIGHMLNMLKDSPSHNANMVSTQMKYIGISIVESGNANCKSHFYMVQHFAKG